MDGRVRTVLASIVIALVLVVPLTLLFAGGGGDGDGGDPASSGGYGLRLERSGNELIVYVDQADNVPERSGGARAVTVRCVDAGNRLVVAANQAWPFTDTDSGTRDPHAHIPLDPTALEAIAVCRVLGSEPLLEGSLAAGP